MCHGLLCISFFFGGGGGRRGYTARIYGLQAAIAPPAAPQQQGKMGQRFTTSAAADMQAPYAEHFPPIRSRRCTRHSPLDAFVLWLDRWWERAVKYTHRGTTTSRGEAANIHNTPIKEKQMGERKLATQSFGYIFIARKQLILPPETTQHPKLMRSACQPCSSLDHNNHISRIKCFL